MLANLKSFLSADLVAKHRILDSEYAAIISDYLIVNAQLLAYQRAKISGMSKGLLAKLLRAGISKILEVCLAVNNSPRLEDISMSFKKHLEVQLKYFRSVLYEMTAQSYLTEE